MSDKAVDPVNLTLSQEAELNAKSASLETFDQKMGFETFYKLGSSRTFVKVAGQLGKSTRTIERWAAEYRWVPRVRERERQAAEYLLMQKSAEEEAKTKEKHLTLIDATVSKWSQALLSGDIKLKSVEDLERLIRLRWDISGIPEKRVNPAALHGGGGMIDLRLRNMDRGELQKFLHGTLTSISRIMNKRPLIGPEQGAEPGDQDKINMDLRVSIGEAAPQTKDAQRSVIDVDSVSVDTQDLSNDFEDLNLDLDDITDIDP